jgi:hypothetical protein
MKQYIVPAAMKAQALENLKMFFYTNPLPFHLIDDGFLRKAFAAFGITLPGRTQLSTTMLDNTYKEVKQQMMSKIPAGGHIAPSTDGWKKKAAEQGVPLINVNILLPGGGSIFHKVVTAGGVVKNAQWIFDQHVALAEELIGGKPELLIGFLMDNTKANRKAQDMLEEHEPRWLAIGCQAHGLLLLIKDLADPKNTQNPPGNKAKKSARHNGEHAAPSSPDSKSKKPTSTLFRTTVVRGLGQAGPGTCPTRPSQHPNRRPIQEMITPHQSNTQFAQGTINKRGPRNSPRARSLFAQRVQKLHGRLAQAPIRLHRDGDELVTIRLQP